jgi:hypothetical protein
MDFKEESPKQETLREVAERIFANNIDGLRDALIDDDLFFFYKGVILNFGEEMVKWQQQTYNQFTLAMDDLKSSRDGYLKAKEEYELKQERCSDKVICKSCGEPIFVEDINSHLFMSIKGGGLIHWNCTKL